MAEVLPQLHIVIHLEPLEDERAYQDLELGSTTMS